MWKANQTSFKKGHKQSEESRKKMSAKKLGKPSWNKGLNIQTNTGKTHFKKGDERLLGENNPKWSGGSKLVKQEKVAGRKKPEQCEICGSIGRICFDHNHKNNQFRGWICARCNIVLGLVKDNSELLKSLSEYLNATDTKWDLVATAQEA